MANQAKNQKSKLLYLGIIAVAVVIAFYVFKVVGERGYTLQGNNSNLTSNGSKIYTSNTLKFSINIPLEYTVEDSGITVNLKYNEKKISIARNGTNYSNLMDYLINFDSKRNLVESDRIETSINSFSAVSRIVDFSEENIKQKSYYILADNFVYILSADSQSLYGDLDQIAQSFRYTQ